MSTKQTPESEQTPSPTAPITLSIEMLNALAATVTQAVMAGLKAQQGAIPDDLGETIGNAVASGMSKSTRRKITIGEYINRMNTLPDGTRRPTLARICWQNDHEIRENVLSVAEINLLNQLHRSGRYIDRLVQVIIGFDAGEEVVYIRYHDKGDHKFALSGAGVRNFETMLKMILTEQAAEDAEDEREEERTGRKPSGARSFGSGRNTRRAEEAAGR
jgi:hypothetical protein